MKKSNIKKWTAGLFLSGLSLASTSTGAIVFNISSLNSNSDPDAPVDWFSVGLTLDGAGKATFSLTNRVAPGNGTKISDIWLGTTGADHIADGFFSLFQQDGVLSGVGTFNYDLDYAPNSNQGGVPWGVEVTANAKNGNDNSTLNPGETLNMTFSLLNSLTTEQQLVDAFHADPQQLGFAFHVQSIGAYSEKYQAIPVLQPDPRRIPDGGATLSLMGLALGGLAAGRRFLKK
jgi:hypothetical protein